MLQKRFEILAESEGKKVDGADLEPVGHLLQNDTGLFLADVRGFARLLWHLGMIINQKAGVMNNRCLAISLKTVSEYVVNHFVIGSQTSLNTEGMELTL